MIFKIIRYIREGIKWEQITYFNNKIICGKLLNIYKNFIILLELIEGVN